MFSGIVSRLIATVTCLFASTTACGYSALMPGQEQTPSDVYVDPDNPPPTPFELSMLGANALSNRDQLVQHYESMLVEFADHAQLAEVMAQLAVVSGYYDPEKGEHRDTRKMLYWYEQAMNQATQDQEVWKRSGLQAAILNREIGELETSKKKLDVLRHVYPNDEEVLFESLRTEVESGDFEEGLTFFRKLSALSTTGVFTRFGGRTIARGIYFSKKLKPAAKSEKLRSVVATLPASESAVREFVGEFLRKLDAKSQKKTAPEEGSLKWPYLLLLNVMIVIVLLAALSVSRWVRRSSS
jgi:hypothetical protein